MFVVCDYTVVKRCTSPAFVSCIELNCQYRAKKHLHDYKKNPIVVDRGSLYRIIYFTVMYSICNTYVY